jgi:pimeloyl-ACP methyl ester carboxylesterase
MPAPFSEHLDLNGLRHHLLRWPGEPGAGALVLLHGYLDQAWSFAPFVDALRRLHPVEILAPDLRGHGGTEWVGRGGYYHFPDYVADLAALLRTTGKPLYLLGHSMGGSVAALLAGTCPERVDRLILVEGLGPPSEPETEPPDRMAQWLREVDERRARPPRPMPTLELARERLQQANPRLTPELATLLAGKATRPVEGGFVWAYDPLHRTRSPSPSSVAVFRTFLRRIACPTLLIDASDSPFRAWIDDDRATELRDRRTCTIADAGHMLHQDQPDALAREVASFLPGAAP